MAATTNISSYFKVPESDNGTLALHVETQFKFFGASIIASVEPRYNGVAPITFVPPKKDTVGLIVASVRWNNDTYYPFFLKIGWKNDKPYIYAKDKDNPWVPPAEKLAQIVHDGTALSVQIDGEWYTTDAHGITGNRVSISTGNLICRYLVSTDHKESQKLAEEIKQDSEKIKEEMSAREVARAEKSSDKNEIVHLKARLNRKSEQFYDYKKAILRIENILKKVTFWNSRDLSKKIENVIKPLVEN